LVESSFAASRISGSRRLAIREKEYRLRAISETSGERGDGIALLASCTGTVLVVEVHLLLAMGKSLCINPRRTSGLGF